jgi:DNA polymerase-3 subunit gamma/tau
MAAIKKLLKEIADAEKLIIDDTSLTLIAKKADGALRDAQSLFDQVISFCNGKVESDVISKMLNLIDEEIFFDVSEAILEKNFKAAFDITNRIYENGWSFSDFLNGLNEHFRNILTVIIRKNYDLIESAEIYKEKYLEYIDKFSEGELLRILNLINKTHYELKTSTNHKLKIEITLCLLIGLEKSSTISDIINKINSGITSEPVKNYASPGSFESKKISPDKILSNVRVVEKSEVKLPEVKNFIPPTARDSSDFNAIIAKWEFFVEQVKTDKLFFGSILNNSNPVDISNDKINLEVEHSEDWDIITDNKPYLDKKTKEVFGKRIEFNNAGKKKAGSNKKTSKSKEEKSLENSEGNSLVNAVINQLGGKEIKK